MTETFNWENVKKHLADHWPKQLTAPEIAAEFKYDLKKAEVLLDVMADAGEICKKSVQRNNKAEEAYCMDLGPIEDVAQEAIGHLNETFRHLPASHKKKGAGLRARDFLERMHIPQKDIPKSKRRHNTRRKGSLQHRIMEVVRDAEKKKKKNIDYQLIFKALQAAKKAGRINLEIYSEEQVSKACSKMRRENWLARVGNAIPAIWATTPEGRKSYEVD